VLEHLLRLTRQILAVADGRTSIPFQRLFQPLPAFAQRQPAQIQAVEEREGMEPDATWLDGEIVGLREDGRSSFQALPERLRAGKDAQIVYFCRCPVPQRPGSAQAALSERRKRLKQALERNRSPAIRYSEDLAGEAKEVLEHACKLGLEGLMASRPTRSTFRAARRAGSS